MSATMKARKACWTCTDRRVRCDGASPTCQSCARLQLSCQGYGMRLSWPQDSDSRRAIVGQNTSSEQQQSRHQARGDAYFVNTIWTDMTMFCGFSLHIQPSGADIMPVMQLERQMSYMDLLHYFHNEAYRSLATLDKSNFAPQLRDVLLRLSTSHHSTSALSVFFSLLAYSSLHRHGLQVHAVELQVTAIRLLSASLATSNQSDTVAAAQQIAASMLLTAFDILSPPEGSKEWLWHVWGANDVICKARLQAQDRADTDVLIAWVHYHNTLTRFALLHWRNESSVETSRTEHHISHDEMKVRCETVCGMSTFNRPRCELLNLLNEAYAIVSAVKRGDSRFIGDVEDLSQRIQSLSTSNTVGASKPFDAGAIELYKLATTIYIVRASQRPTESTLWLDSIIDAAFRNHLRAYTIPHFFPLLIFACEARNDERRITILEMLETVSSDSAIGSIDRLKELIRALWAQQDLNADVDLLAKYTSLLDTAISSSGGLPSFA